MKNRSSLVLMEVTVMLLVFVAVSALCLRAFAWADRTSERSLQTDKGYLYAQNAAQVFKNSGGEWKSVEEALGGESTENGWQIALDEHWQETESAPAFFVKITPLQTDLTELGRATVTVSTESGELLAELPVAWQQGEQL